MAKKTKTSTRRTSKSSAKKSTTLKIKQRLSVFQVVIIGIVVALAVLISAYQTGGENAAKAAATSTIGSGSRSLVGRTVLGSSNTYQPPSTSGSSTTTANPGAQSASPPPSSSTTNTGASSTTKVLSVVVSGGTVTVTGTGLDPNSTIQIGRSKYKASAIGANADGTTTIGAPVNQSSCLFANIPFLGRLCNSAKIGNNDFKVTSDGQTITGTINLGRSSNSASAAGQAALGSGGLGSSGSSGGGGNGGVICGPSCGDNSAACFGDVPNGSNGMFPKYKNGKGGLKWIHPTSGDVWNYGSPFTFEWQNPGSKLGQDPNAVLSQKTAIAQITLIGGCMKYNVNHWMDCDKEGIALAKAKAAELKLSGDLSSDCPFTTTDPLGHSAPLYQWLNEMDDDQDGASNHMLCVGIMKSGGRNNISNLDEPGADIKLTISTCTYGKVPTGQYQADLQVFGVSAPAGCAPGKRCSGLPDKLGGSAGEWEAISEPFQINSN